MKKIKSKIIRTLLSVGLSLVLVFTSSASAFAQEAPSAPPAPSAPSAPTAPSTPSAPPSVPSAPQQPSVPSAPTVPSAPSVPEQHNTPSPKPSPKPTVQSTVPSPSPIPNPTQKPSSKPVYEGASGNTGVDSTTKTGDASAGGTVKNDANKSTVTFGDGEHGSNCSACVGSTTAKNSGNGEGSTNTANAAQYNETDLDLVNRAVVVNNANFEAETGKNKSSKNTGGDSSITTGDADVMATIITNANNVALDVYNFNVNSNSTGDIILDPANATAANIGNGANSTNSANADTSNVLNQTITNEGDIINNINLEALSGKNEASKNTGGDSSITTGDANIVANVINSLNTIVTGALYTVNILDDYKGNIVAPKATASGDACCGTCGGNVTVKNSGNGADSENNADANVENTTNINQTNIANIENNIDLDANTGGNQASKNTGGSSAIETGDVTVDANVANIANINVASDTCEPVHMVFINDVGGNWNGTIKGAIPGSYYVLPDGSIYLADANGGLVLVNSGNGAGSTNTATGNVNNETNVNQTNVANITNNIRAKANTGDNETSYNTNGDSSITTGDASIMVNVINFVNSNFYGRELAMTVVNVLGSWLGDFWGSGYNPDEHSNALASVNLNVGGGDSGGGSGGGSSSGGSTSGVGGATVTLNNGSINFNSTGNGFGGLFGGITTDDDSQGGSGGGSLYNSVTKVAAVDDSLTLPFDWRYLVAAIAFMIIARTFEKKIFAVRKVRTAYAHEISVSHSERKSSK